MSLLTIYTNKNLSSPTSLGNTDLPKVQGLSLRQVCDTKTTKNISKTNQVFKEMPRTLLIASNLSFKCMTKNLNSKILDGFYYKTVAYILYFLAKSKL